MIRFSLFAMVALTVLIAMGLRWREQRLAATAPRLGVAGRAKRTVNRWATAAALAVVTTMLVLGGLHWMRLWNG